MVEIHDVIRLNARLQKWTNYCLGAGVVGLILCAISVLRDRHAFFASYVTAFIFFTAIALGALFFVMVQFAARSAWSVTVRRLAETLASNIWVMALLSVPILLCMHDVFRWSLPSVRATDHLVQIKIPYLNIPMFTLRAVVYFGAWFAFASYFLKTSRKQDETGDPNLTLRMAKVAGGGLVFYALSQTFFSFDWIMSLDPHWFSSIFGVYFFAGSIVAFYAVLILLTRLMQSTGHLRNTVNTEHYHDMGKLMFGHNIFWTYIAFGQFILYWYANIPEEVAFFHHRAVGSWMFVSLTLPWCHFAIPFLFLMSHNVKRNTKTLAFGAVWLLVMCFVDIYWLVQPNFHPQGAVFGLSDISALLAVGGFFAFFFLHKLRQANLIPVQDPRLAECLNYDNGM